MSTLDSDLAAWRAKPTIKAADALMEAAGSGADVKSPPSKEAFQDFWVTTCRANPDAATQAWLATTFTTRVPIHAEYGGILEVDYVVQKYASVLARLEAWSHVQASPFAAEALCRTLEAAPYSAMSSVDAIRIYQPLLEALVRQRDVRMLPRLEALSRKPTAKREAVRAALAQALPAAIEEMSSWPEAAKARARVEKPTSSQDGEALWRAVCEAGDDDGPLLVWADWLMERNNPRGEFVALSLKHARGAATPKDLKTIGKLARAHQKAWLGELGAVLKHVELRRGLLHSAEVAQNAAATSEGWQQAANHRELATLRVLTKGTGSASNLFLLASHARHLEAVELANWRQAAEWAQVTTTSLRSLRVLEEVTQKGLGGIENITAFANVETLGVKFSRTTQLATKLSAEPWLKRLKTLSADIDWMLAPLPHQLVEIASVVEALGVELELTAGALRAKLTRTNGALLIICDDDFAQWLELLWQAFPKAEFRSSSGERLYRP